MSSTSPKVFGTGSESNPYLGILRAQDFRHYVDKFNRDDEDLYLGAGSIANADAWDFLKNQIPRFDCPDKNTEEIYYFRWWTYRKHIRETTDGYVITEFLPPVPWAGKHNTINCPAAFHISEGRWLHDPRFIDDDLRFWLRRGGDVRRYSFWIADAAWHRFLVTGDAGFVLDLLPDLVRNYKVWEATHRDANGLYWQEDASDGMEISIGGSGYRATINSYMFGDALAIGAISELAGESDQAHVFREKAAELKRLVQGALWDPDAAFFKVLPRESGAKLAAVREQHGFTPWFFNLPDPGYERAWEQLTDSQGFAAPFGPTTAEQRGPGFRVAYEGHECQWNGPSWPYATSITLTALANLLNNYPQVVMTKQDYFELLNTYTKSHRRRRDDGTVVPWIDENLNPFTGDWISRTLLLQRQQPPRERGKDYNHSLYNDLIISGLVGLRPRSDELVEVNPLLPDDEWEYFCLDQVLYHGRTLTILYDKTGERYGLGAGLRLFADGEPIGHAPALGPLSGILPAP